jgi:transcriptional regulator with XRE-family HTH domain
MPRPPATPATALGAEIQRRRDATDLRVLGDELGVSNSTLSRIERGTNRPTYDTAVKLGAWLGWTTDQVMEAAARPAPAAEE